jgi:monothiol glutaredoxin
MFKPSLNILKFQRKNFNKLFKIVPKINLVKNFKFNFSIGIKEEQAEDTHPDFKKQVKQAITDENVMQVIDDWVKNNDVVLFMKGTREMPRCGFSNYLVQVLNHFNLRKVKIVNILENPTVREAVKQYSSWPTYPQLYVKGNLIGRMMYKY